MIKPTIGRVVWYYPHGRTQKEANKQPHAAIIAHVYGDDCISIGYFDSNGVAKFATSVHLCQDSEPRPDFAFAEWMPYQIGQAAKAEALEKKLGGLPEDISAATKSDPTFDNMPRSK